MSVLRAVAYPESWSKVRLGVVARRVSEPGYGDLELLSVFLGDGVVPRSDRDDNHNQLGADLEKYQRVLPGDLVFNKLRTWQGGFGVSRYTGIVSPAYIIARPKPEIHPGFLHHYMRSEPVLAELTRLSKWMPPSQFDINWDEIRNVTVPLPPLEEQRRIADFLDDQVARIDAVNQRRERQSELALEAANATLALFLSDPWLHLPLRRVVARWIDYRGATPTKTDEGVPLITAGNIREGSVNLNSPMEFISVHDYDEWMRRGLPEVGDVLFTTEAPMGEVAVLDRVDVALAQRVVLMRPDRSVVCEQWLAYSLRSSQFQGRLRSQATGSTALGIKVDRLRGIHIPVPDLQSQLDASASQAAVEAEVKAQRRALALSHALLSEYKRSLITAAVMGELDVTTARRGVPA